MTQTVQASVAASHHHNALVGVPSRCKRGTRGVRLGGRMSTTTYDSEKTPGPPCRLHPAPWTLELAGREFLVFDFVRTVRRVCHGVCNLPACLDLFVHGKGTRSVRPGVRIHTYARVTGSHHVAVYPHTG